MSNDSKLKDAVLAELKWEPSVNEAHIGVTARDGVVTLMGHVESFVEKHAAETAASRVKGVKAVVEELEVRLNSSIKKTDEDIAAAAVSRLSWNSSIPSDAIKVKVEKGWVTLTGSVEWNYQKSNAHADIRWLNGVVGVSNEIAIKTKVDTTSISDDIDHALHRSWFFDPKTIFVSAVGGKVKLTGDVETYNDRQVAGMTAWAAPGATAVENDIRVTG
ncbi:MAG: BON domain-containing protein [Beijerinckiaceae bacterium]